MNAESKVTTEHLKRWAYLYIRPIRSETNQTSVLRLYRPRGEILSGIWKFPEAQPVP